MITVANPIYDAVFKYLMEDERIARTLLSAASDAKVRQDMNVEEEYFQAIENRDTAIMMRDENIKEQDNQIAEQRNVILTSAKALKNAGLPVEQIASMTNLTIEEINNL